MAVSRKELYVTYFIKMMIILHFFSEIKVFLFLFLYYDLYYLKITGNWNHIYINYLLTIEYTYLHLDVEATMCLSLKYINTRIHMTPSVKYVIKIKFEKNSTIYLFVQYFRKTTIDCLKSITENFQVCINLLN